MNFLTLLHCYLFDLENKNSTMNCSCKAWLKTKKQRPTLTIAILVQKPAKKVYYWLELRKFGLRYLHESKRKYLVEASSDFGGCTGRSGNGGGQRAERYHSCIQSASADLDFHLILNVEALQTSQLLLFTRSNKKNVIAACSTTSVVSTLHF